MSQQNLVAVLIFFALLMFLLGLYIAIKERIIYRGRIQSRLQASKGQRIASEAELFDIRQSRSLTADGYFAISIVSLNKLILQSGTSLGFSGVVGAALACAGVAFLIAYLADAALLLSIPAAIAGGIGLPFIVLRAMRDGRQRKFEDQLPEAVDTLVRGLKAGHAVSVAISSLAQNMPDPIGAEFRLTAAEMTYGLDLETAMANLHTRVGQPDLGLIALAVSMQSKTGGNLAEVLANLSRIIRERFKLRRKAHALAAEGRFSALILSALPVLLFCVIWFLSPNYYSDVWDEAYTKPVLAGAVLWMSFGNYVMYRMVRIRV
ncbi:MAG: type II secretion system F family protein [Rhodomicrobium sp.]